MNLQSFTPAEAWLFALSLFLAFLSAYQLWQIAQSEEEQRRRLEALRGPAFDAEQAARLRPPPWYQRLGHWLAATPIFGTAEQQRLLQVLSRAGLAGQGNLATFAASKLCAALAWATLVWLVIEWRHWFAGSATIRMAILFGALMVGWRIPDFVLKRLVNQRRQHLEQGIPDALDLLVICAEAGLTLNQAVEQVSRDLRLSSPVVAYEFAATAAEMRVSPDAGQTLDNLVLRTGLDSLRSLTATLKQSLKFGTPLAEALRVLAAEMRATRQALFEERAARLPVLLAIPMMIFILPCLLLVIGTPVALRIVDTFSHMHVGTLGLP
ncbi:MAG TPA: type II secretion system F family protein [Stellaceae bacterium]|jgi:tight adherence protein C|nr:type II secretion system F family protein [Stellaceae bacterium]